MDRGRVTVLIERLSGVSYTLGGVSFLLHRLGFSPQVPALRACERTRTRSPSGGPQPGEGTRLAAVTGAWSASRTRQGSRCAGQGPRLGAPRAHPGSVRQRAAVGGGHRVREARRPGRFFYCLRVHSRRKGERPSLSEADYARLITAARHAQGAPLIVIWDNLNTQRTRMMRPFTEAREGWMTVVQLPGNAPTSTRWRAPGQR